MANFAAISQTLCGMAAHSLSIILRKIDKRMVIINDRNNAIHFMVDRILFDLLNILFIHSNETIDLYIFTQQEKYLKS